MSFARRVLALPAAVVLAAAVSACGGGPAPATRSEAPGAAPPAATKNQTNPTPRNKVEDAGTFTYALDTMPTNFNYNELDGTPLDNANVISALMPTPFTNDATAAPVWNPNYLSAAPVVVTAPKQIVTYAINPKAAWYDGTPITWEDFYWQWKANNGTNKAYRVASTNGYEAIENVAKGPTDRDVVVTFTQRYADWQALFSPFYPASTNKDPAIFNDGWKDHPLTTAGPFKVDRIDRTTQTITLVRNEKWWGNRAKLNSIISRVMEPDAQIDAIANGEIDAMDIGPDANKYNRAKSIAGTEIRAAGGPNFRHLTFNGTSRNLQDVRVRQALAMAIDRRAIARALLGPLGLAGEALDNHIFMANQDGYQANAGEVGTYNPQKARQMLDDAGWTLKGQTRMKDGRPLELTCVIPSGVATAKQETELVQNMLAQVGVKMAITAVPVGDFFDKYITTGQFDLTVFAWMGTAYPMSSAKSVYAKPTTNAKGELQIQQNYARTGSDEIDGLFSQASQELDRKKAVEIANRLDALLWQEVHSLTLYQRPELVLCKKDLANFGAFGFAGPWVYEDIGWTPGAP